MWHLEPEFRLYTVFHSPVHGTRYEVFVVVDFEAQIAHQVIVVQAIDIVYWVSFKGYVCRFIFDGRFCCTSCLA